MKSAFHFFFFNFFLLSLDFLGFFVFVLFDLHVPHVNLPVHEKYWRPFTLFTPILFVHGFLNIDVFNFSLFVFYPFPSI